MYSKETENTDLKKARQSLIEELEAVNWYETRIEDAENEELKKILEHNRDEEKEHVAMLLEWIRENDFRIPEDDEGVFEILLSKGIISERLSSKLRDAKGMRNIIAHEYGNIDDELIFEAISNELKKDVEDFIDNIEKFK